MQVMKLELFQHNHANSNFSFAPLLSYKTAPNNTNTNNKLGVSMCGRQYTVHVCSGETTATCRFL